MQVTMARPALCQACHGVPHLSVENQCATCHDPLTRASRLTTADVAGLPKPAWHDSADFLLRHGQLASASEVSCSVCHARESCARCHLNADRVAPIQALQPDPRIAQLVRGRAGEWPEPASHQSADWVLAHGKTARASLSTCADCHAASSCATCHRGPRAGFLSQMPRAVEGGPSGVHIEGLPPGHGPGWALQHGATAASGAVTCSSCHTAAQCTTCHRGGVPSSPAMKAPGTGGSGGGADSDGPMSLSPARDGSGGGSGPAVGRTGARSPAARPVVLLASLRTARWDERPDTAPPATENSAGAPGAASQAHPSAPRTGGFHPPDYLLRHGADAFARRVQCTECHSAQAFCLACHEKMGIGRGGARGSPAFHDAQPDWLIVHGRAARQNLESCVSCHQQSSCLRCHSAKFGFRISPHGPGFDPSRIADRSTISCGICHFSLPQTGGGS
jgi:hypothetical protein